MNRLIVFACVFGAFGSLVGGCDDSSSVPQAVIDQAAKPPPKVDKAPTTQELLAGPRGRIALVPLPLTLTVPPGWGPMKDAPAPNLVKGYTPTGIEVQIQLTPRASMKQEALDRLVNAAKKEMAAKPAEIVKAEIRPLGSVKVFERQKVGPPAPFTTYDSNNVPHETMESNFTWTLSVLVPHEGAIEVFEVNFIGLTKNQYDKDKEFLQGVLSTLQYAGDATGATSAPSAATAPATVP